MTVLLLSASFIRWISHMCLLNGYVTSNFNGLVRITHHHHCTTAVIICLTVWWTASRDMNTWWPFFNLILTLVIHGDSHHVSWCAIVASTCLNYILINEASDVPGHPKLVIVIHLEYIEGMTVLLLNCFTQLYRLIWEDRRAILLLLLLLLLLLIFYDSWLH